MIWGTLSAKSNSLVAKSYSAERNTLCRCADPRNPQKQAFDRCCQAVTARDLEGETRTALGKTHTDIRTGIEAKMGEAANMD